MNKIIVPTGYMGSGSSAITNLISEMKGYSADQGTFEYVFLHCPNGVFDLEDKLLIGNNAIRSDEAIHSFLHTMKQLYDKKYWWVGHYKENVGENFWNLTQEYVDSIVQFHPSFYWYQQENCDAKMIVKLVIKRLVKYLTFGKVDLPKPLLYPQMLVSYIKPQEFYSATKKYLDKIWIELGINSKNIILDQLLLPFNLHRFNNYFDNNAEVFVVERDPRDVFLINKYIFSHQNATVPYPTDAEEFARCYKALREIEKPCENSHIHRIYFEDLIYKYDESVEMIMKSLDIGKNGHVDKFKYFDPKKSIRNTQLFLRNKEYQKEIKPIYDILGDYLYDFPYEYQYDGGETF